MRYTVATVTLFVALSAFGQGAAAQDAKPAKTATPAVQLVEFQSAESQRRLARSSAKVDFFRLVNEFEPQMNMGTCGPTSAVIVLNALRGRSDARRPVDRSAFPEDRRKLLPPGFEPVKPRYTQRSFFDERFAAVKPFARFYGEQDEAGERDPGMQIGQLHQILERHEVDATLRIVTAELPAKEVKAELIANLERADDYVIVNYHREAIGQRGGGHISPVGAYDAKSDSFLMMDVNPNAAPWVWVKAPDLIAAMRTPDQKQNRGYILVRDKASSAK